MKCPKCGYLGFEHIDRCRNCGYDFSLSQTVSIPDLPMRNDPDPINPLDDFSLVDAATAPLPSVPMSDVGPDLERLLGAPPASARARPVPATPHSDLTLFGPEIPDDEPLITRPSPPRPPLAVRRATPDAVRLRNEPRMQSLDLGLELEPSPKPRPQPVTPGARAIAANGQWPEPRPERAESADISARLLAVAIDLAILLAIDVLVVYFTVQICGVSLDELGILPKGPLLAFLLVQNGGYLVAFTVGGQTLGKMVTGIRVVTTESTSGSLDVGRAFTRTIVWLALAAPAGLGFLTLFSRDHRGLHDRFAGTRVVRASA